MDGGVFVLRTTIGLIKPSPSAFIKHVTLSYTSTKYSPHKSSGANLAETRKYLSLNGLGLTNCGQTPFTNSSFTSSTTGRLR